ncbi:MAG TPA: CHRD domain-containing protein, partial [Stellaceae bacterium]|nr:CHRD domain-containing protein [Stellaceae bacterium]
AVLSDGTGTAKLNLDQEAGTIAYTLTYSNVGTTPPKTGTVLFAHIHFGKSRDSGGILVFFCTNRPFTGTGPTPPACPDNSGTVSGMWTADNVQAIAGQNVQAGDFDALVDALESDTAYANIHTTSGTTPENAFPGGEIRGQVHAAKREEERERGR